jgi:hypothetical protein
LSDIEQLKKLGIEISALETLALQCEHEILTELKTLTAEISHHEFFRKELCGLKVAQVHETVAANPREMLLLYRNLVHLANEVAGIDAEKACLGKLNQEISAKEALRKIQLNIYYFDWQPRVGQKNLETVAAVARDDNHKLLPEQKIRMTKEAAEVLRCIGKASDGEQSWHTTLDQVKKMDLGLYKNALKAPLVVADYPLAGKAHTRVTNKSVHFSEAPLDLFDDNDAKKKGKKKTSAV